MSGFLNNLFGNPNQPQQGPFSFGPSLFSLAALQGAGADNAEAIANRYTQLGMGGSTPEQQDLSGNQLAINAAIGQEQTADVTNPAINTSLQQPIATGNPSQTSSLSGLASGLGSILGNIG